MALRFLRNALGVSLLVAGSFLCAGISAQAASPGLPVYPWDLRKKMPVHYQAYLKILPTRLKRTAWFGRFDGTGMPVERVAVDGKAYFTGGICKPHDCADNYLTFLITADGSRAVAMVKATETGGQIVELGNPMTAERQFMAKEFQD
ncbi:inhibitor of vertebrate lysozyme family protein (plasmid) [Microvirga terrae]|uniref:Inhibitor of vertebrate lysozyme family protein n=1 Tax=Microvirga terrae TaxID=2740529 RepID=A0ABY5S448_9HYPH|nr:Ivy family c-type lysozyme inhibitor [Microvirga terrae]UVF22762.1 inhibitor of vertebrate lysozyme family protein [Microvirga terrae]